MKRKILSIVLSLCMVLSLFVGVTMTASAEAPEVTLSNDLGTSSYTLITSSNTQTDYNLTVDMDATGLTTPILKITVPSGFTLNSYPTSTDSTLSSSYAATDPVSKSTDENGDTLLTYKWITDADVSFSLNVTPTIQGCYSQDYAVTATLLEDTTEKSTAADTITITNPTTSEDSFSVNYNSSRYTSTVTLDDSTTDYYVPVGFSASPYRFYLFDKFEITLPLVSGTTPCYKAVGTSTYTDFVDGARTWVETGASTYSLNFQGYVTYDSDYVIDGAAVPALIIELFPQDSTVDGYTIGNQSSWYTYWSTGGYGCALQATSNLYSRYDIGIYEKYTSPTADTTYQPSKSAQLVGCYDNDTPDDNTDDTTVTLCAFKASDSNYTVTFNEFTWEEHFCLTSTYARFCDVNNGWNFTVQSEADRYCFSTYFFSDIDSTLPATDVQLKFTADEKLYCHKILINAGSSLTVAPTSMEVSYKTIKGGDTVYTATVSAATTDSSLWYTQALCFAPTFDDDDGIVEATLTLDRLGPSASSTTGNEFIRAFVRNVDYDGSSVSASVQLLGGSCDTSYCSDGTFGSQTAITATTSLSAYIYSMSNTFVAHAAGSSEISTLSKGDSFAIVVNNSNYSYLHSGDSFFTEVVNPEYYLLMSGDYVFNGFTPASDWGDVSYTLTSSEVTVDSTAAATYGISEGDYVLYTVKFAEGTYAGGAGLSKSQLFAFTVGPTKDTSSVTYPELPVLVGFRNDSEHFVDSSTKYEDLLDVDGDSDTSETMVFKTGDSVTINAAAAFSTYSALTSDAVSGVQNSTMSYTNGGSGTAVVTINNGSTATVSDFAVTFAIGKQNTALGSYTANWDANVTVAPTLTDGLAGASVSYSTDNGSNYSDTAPADFSTVTNVKITLSSISTGISGTVSVPFTAAFADDTTASDYSYIQTSISYNSGSSNEKILTLKPSATDVDGVSASGYSGDYDSTAHGITVTAPTGATIKYGTASGSYTLDASPTYTDVGNYTVYYCVSQTGYFAVTGSETVNISKADQPAPTTVGKTDETIENAADGTITGVTDKMEYSADSGTSWTAITGATVTGLSAGTYLVRYAADSNHNAGTATEIVIVIDEVDTTYTGTPSTGSNDSDDGAKITVNGETHTAGVSETSTNSNGQTQTTVTVDSEKVEELLKSEGDGATVTIPIPDGSDVSSGVLTGQVVKNMEEKAATLVVQTSSATYTLPAEEIDIDDIAQQFGANVSLSDIEVEVTISEPDSSTVQVVENSAEEGGFSLVVQAVEFTVKCTFDGQTTEVTTYNAYVERTIEIPEGVDPNAITTAVVVEADGAVRHVPTQITVIDGVYYAVINSLTNSVYTVIYNPLEFEDVDGHWAQDAVNSMTSRLVINGYEDGIFDPDGDITRAEFVAIIVRALGLAEGMGENTFSDVDADAWYCGYIETASSYGIINGYTDGTFRPTDNITGEQAMTMIARAMAVTQLEYALTDSEAESLLAGYSDAADAAAYARESVAACLKTGVVETCEEYTLYMKENIARAEVAVIVQSLLQQSELI